MKKICIPVLMKEYTLVVLVFWTMYKFIILADTTSNPLYIIAILVLLKANFILNLFIKCPKCDKSLQINKNGMCRFPLLHCDKCGQNLMKCNLESKEDK